MVMIREAGMTKYRSGVYALFNQETISPRIPAKIDRDKRASGASNANDWFDSG